MTHEERMYQLKVFGVYPHYITKVEKKGRTKAELDELIFWLTGYDAAGLKRHLELKSSFEQFFKEAPAMNPKAGMIKGLICGYRVEEIQDPLVQQIRYLDKLVDDLAKGKKMEKILFKDQNQ
jgi:hypothetical protein